MTPESQRVAFRSRNVLLSAADSEASPGRRVRLAAGQGLDLAGDVIWFPLTAVVRMEVGDPLVLGGWIGDEGAVGLAEGLEGDHSNRRALVEVGGEAWAVPRASVAQLMSQSSSFTDAVVRWLAKSLAEARRAAAFNACGNARDRVTNLIETLDRLHGHGLDFPMSQAEMARLTGIQRTTVCGIVVGLKREKRITHTRARFRVLRRL